MLRIIFYTVVIVLVLSFFGISIQSIIHSPTGQENFGFIGKLVSDGWRFIVTFIVGGIHWLRAVV